MRFNFHLRAQKILEVASRSEYRRDEDGVAKRRPTPFVVQNFREGRTPFLGRRAQLPGQIRLGARASKETAIAPDNLVLVISGRAAIGE